VRANLYNEGYRKKSIIIRRRHKFRGNTEKANAVQKFGSNYAEKN